MSLSESYAFDLYDETNDDFVGDGRPGVLRMEVRTFGGGGEALETRSGFLGDGNGILDLSEAVTRTEPVRANPGAVNGDGVCGGW